MRRSTVAALSLSSAMILTGAAQAADGSQKRSLVGSPAIAKSTDSLLIAAAGGSAPKSAGEHRPTNKKTTKRKSTTKKKVGKGEVKTFSGAKGVDRLRGRVGKEDQFQFAYYPDFIDPSIIDLNPHYITTLDDGDRIANYEFGEHIVINGIKMVSEQGERFEHVKIVYDAKKNETRIEIDMGGPKTGGKADGKVDRTIILTGDKRGTLKVDAAPCCVGNMTEIWIEKAEKPKTAKSKKKKAKREATKTRARRHHVKRSRVKRSRVKRSRVRRRAKPIQRHRYPNQGVDPVNLSGGG